MHGHNRELWSADELMARALDLHREQEEIRTELVRRGLSGCCGAELDELPPPGPYGYTTVSEFAWRVQHADPVGAARQEVPRLRDHGVRDAAAAVNRRGFLAGVASAFAVDLAAPRRAYSFLWTPPPSEASATLRRVMEILRGTHPDWKPYIIRVRAPVVDTLGAALYRAVCPTSASWPNGSRPPSHSR